MNPFMSSLVVVTGAGMKVKVVYNPARVDDQEGLHGMDLTGYMLLLKAKLIQEYSCQGPLSSQER